MSTWNRLIRFVGNDGKIYRGEPILKGGEDIGQLIIEGKELEARVIKGDDIFENYTITDEVTKVSKLLGPLSFEDVPIVKCIGLNYMKHIEEAGVPAPPFPSVFYKPNHSVADWGENIPIPSIAQENQCDYEGELCVVIGKTGKNIPQERAFDHIAGYVCGNDVSARTIQLDPKHAGSAPQWNFSKSFDKYCPLGPAIISKEIISDPSLLHLQTRINGELRQDTSTGDLLFNIPQIIAYLSQGTTLEKGTVIMTGTPSGAGMGFKPPKYLTNGDEVKVSISKIGTLVNKMEFE